MARTAPSRSASVRYNYPYLYPCPRSVCHETMSGRDEGYKYGRFASHVDASSPSQTTSKVESFTRCGSGCSASDTVFANPPLTYGY